MPKGNTANTDTDPRWLAASALRGLGSGNGVGVGYFISIPLEAIGVQTQQDSSNE